MASLNSASSPRFRLAVVGLASLVVAGGATAQARTESVTRNFAETISQDSNIPPSLVTPWGNELASSVSENVGHGAEAVGQGTSLDPAPVPEPITIFLGGAGLAFLTYTARKRLFSGRHSVGRLPIGRSVGG